MRWEVARACTLAILGGYITRCSEVYTSFQYKYYLSDRILIPSTLLPTFSFYVMT